MDHQMIALLDTHPAILATLYADFSVANDWGVGETEIRRLLDVSPEPLFLVSDIRQLTMSLDDLIAAASLGSRGQHPIWRHPKIRGVYFVSESKFVKMAAAGLNHPAFGNTKVSVFGSVEEALADIEHVLAIA